MTSFTGIPCHFVDVAFVPRSQLCLPRKLIICRAKLDSAVDGLLHEDHDVIDNFPRLPDTEGQVVPVPTTTKCGRRDTEKLKAVLRVSVPASSGNLPPHIVYLLELGFDIEQIKVMAWKQPQFAHYSLEGKIRPLVEFLLDLGVSKSNIPNILFKRPSFCGFSLSENLIPTMSFLETLGVDKSKWVQLLSSHPGMLTYSRKKIVAVVEFLREVGLSEENIGKALTRCPQILGLSVEDNLRPSVEYLQSLGADITVVLRHSPQTMCLSIEANLKPITKFFLENGFSTEDVGIMISKYGPLYAKSLKRNLAPKWEFFLAMDYPRQDLVRYPPYFGYSLKDRIKPRYSLMKEYGVKFPLSQLLSINDRNFALLLKKKIEKLQSDKSWN